MHWLEGRFRWRHKLCKPNQNLEEFKSLHPSEKSKKLFLQHCPTGKVAVETHHVPPCTTWRFLPGTRVQTARSAQPGTSCRLRWCLPARDSLLQACSQLTRTWNSEPGQCTGVTASFTKGLAEDQGLGSSCDKSCQSYKLKSWVLFPSQPADEVGGVHFPNLFTDSCLDN